MVISHRGFLAAPRSHRPRFPPPQPFFIPSDQTNTPAKLCLLHLCNSLLERLSRSQHAHTQLCGRVLALLSSALPLEERSGVNVVGQGNTANVTLWEDEDHAHA